MNYIVGGKKTKKRRDEESKKKKKKRINLINRGNVYIWDSRCTLATIEKEEGRKKMRCTETRSIIQFSIYECRFRFFFHSEMHDSDCIDTANRPSSFPFIHRVGTVCTVQCAAIVYEDLLC